MFGQLTIPCLVYIECNILIYRMKKLFKHRFVARDVVWQQPGERVAKQDVDDGLVHRFVDFRRQKYFFSSNCNHLEFMRHTHKECCNFAASLSLEGVFGLRPICGRCVKSERLGVPTRLLKI